MKHPLLRRAVPLCAGILVVAASMGCEKAGIKFVVPNSRPSVELTAAPVAITDTAWYSYRMNWSGYDSDGRISQFQYAIDPPPENSGLDTTWISTTKNEQQLFFRATKAYFDPNRGWRSNDLHTFVVRAVDDAGDFSAPKSRSFFSYTIAPVVSITNPLPNKFISQQVTPAVRISWVGRDEDGVFTQKPIKYKYRLFRNGDPEFELQTVLSSPDSLRRFYAARNFAGWDSVSGDTTFVQYTQLTPGEPHIFVVIGFDEAGAYSPDFSLESNMLRFTPGFAGTLGPQFTVFNEFFFFQYSSGGVTTDELNWIKLEVPAGQPLTFNWFATPPPGATIEWYRWRLDGNIFDETPRTDENTDWYHWSRKSPLTTSCTIGPFPGGQVHFLYIMTQDNNGLQSLAVIQLTTVAPTFAKDLLIVDDTRLSPDFYPNGINSPPQQYATVWPSAAELDTFFYARGGVPWRGPQGLTGNLPLSKPGIFAGYSFDTVGTRLGYEIASAGVPLSFLGRYKNVLWLTEEKGLTTTAGPEAVINPISYLRWMSSPGRANTLSTYSFAGGHVWFAGGTTASNSLDPYNATGARNNDNKYGVGHKIYSITAGELAPGRIMFDAAHWRSEMASTGALTTPRRSVSAVGGWSSPGWRYTTPMTAPDYTKLPVSLRRKSVALGDSLPPTSAGNNQRFFQTTLPLSVEYLTDDNRIVEDFDPSPLNEFQRSALDTLFELAGGNLATLISGRRPVTMTYYYGVESPRFVMTGFDLWTWSRQDIARLVDFVLQDLWGLQKTVNPSPAVARPAVSSSPPQPAVTGRSVRLPGGRSGSR